MRDVFYSKIRQRFITKFASFSIKKRDSFITKRIRKMFERALNTPLLRTKLNEHNIWILTDRCQLCEKQDNPNF